LLDFFDFLEKCKVTTLNLSCKSLLELVLSIKKTNPHIMGEKNGFMVYAEKESPIFIIKTQLLN